MFDWTWKQWVGLAMAAFVVYHIFTAPVDAAGWVNNAVDGVGTAFNRLSRFVNAL